MSCTLCRSTFLFFNFIETFHNHIEFIIMSEQIDQLRFNHCLRLFFFYKHNIYLIFRLIFCQSHSAVKGFSCQNVLTRQSRDPVIADTDQDRTRMVEREVGAKVKSTKQSIVIRKHPKNMNRDEGHYHLSPICSMMTSFDLLSGPSWVGCGGWHCHCISYQKVPAPPSEDV